MTCWHESCVQITLEDRVETRPRYNKHEKSEVGVEPSTSLRCSFYGSNGSDGSSERNFSAKLKERNFSSRVMGSCSSRGRPAYVSDHHQHAPMWVVRVGHVLEMKGAFQPHQVLKAQGLLEIRKSKIFTLFVSHQWLSFQHPDPHGEQLKVLQETLKKLIAKQVTVEDNFVTQFYGNKTIEFDGVGDWHMWLDYFCVPQLVEEYQTQLAHDQRLLYLKSIPNYVDRCNLFVALVPRAVHKDTEVACDTDSWLRRGWCRTELWCYHLSAQSKYPIIEVKNSDSVRFISPVWFRYPVHSGDFAVAGDRASCRQVIQRALGKHIAELRESDKTGYRLYLALFEEIAGLPPKLRSLEDFVKDFDFTKPLQNYKGLGPGACAALSGDEELLRRVANANASLHTYAPGMPAALYPAVCLRLLFWSFLIFPLDKHPINMDTPSLVVLCLYMFIHVFTQIFRCKSPRYTPNIKPLTLAMWFRSHDLKILETLLELRAGPDCSTISTPPALGLCRSVEAVDLMLRKGATVDFQGKLWCKLCPLHVAAALGAPPEVTARLLELRADVRGGRGGLASASPLHFVAVSGSRDDLKTAQLLIENRADVNQIVQPEGIPIMLGLMHRAYSLCSAALFSRFFSQLSTTPLGWCAAFGNNRLLVLLLHAQANPEIRGILGLRPIDMARSETTRSILRDPSPHIHLLEYNSDLVTEHIWRNLQLFQYFSVCFTFDLPFDGTMLPFQRDGQLNPWRSIFKANSEISLGVWVNFKISITNYINHEKCQHLINDI